MQKFKYPDQQQQFQRVKGIEHLRKLLLVESQNLKLRFQHFKLSCQKKIYLYARCSKCTCCIKYRLNQQTHDFELLFLRNLHNHLLDTFSFQIQNFINCLPATIQLNSAKKLVARQFSIKQSKFYYHFSKVNRTNSRFSEIIDELNLLKYESRYTPYPLINQYKIPDVFITSSQKMVEQYKLYGDFITFDITYNLIKEFQINPLQNKRSKKKWGLGLIMGKNSNNKPLPFAVIITNCQKKQTMEGIFQSFFQIMGGKKPLSIITDQQASILSAFESLREKNSWEGSNYLDTFHILRAYQRRIKNEMIMKHLHEAMFAEEKKFYEYYLNKAKQFIETSEQAKAIDEFQQKSSLFCISQTRSFHGISISSSFHQKTNDYIKRFIKHQQSATFTVKKVLKLMDDLIDQSFIYKLSSIPFEQYFDNYNLKVLRYTVSQALFKAVLKNFSKCLGLNYKEDGFVWIFQNQICKVNENTKLICCSCQFLERTGVPCVHLLKLIVDLHQNLLNYINDRWKVTGNMQNKKESRQIRVSKGRPRFSRRNKIR